MDRLLRMINAVAANRAARWIGVPVLVASALASLLSQSQTPLPPTVALASEPLYARGARAKPTLTLALSVEFPTVGAQYVNTPGATTDNTYSPATKYVGYFDTESCYSYNNNTDPNLQRFDRIGAATSRTCGGNGFSGNFMNWATSSAIDVLRLGLTGGDRVVDTSALTVLQRAVLPNTSVSSNFWNGSNFPSKILAAGLVDGAVPLALKGSYTGDIYVANCLNRVHFGTQATGSCAAPGNNSNLGTGTLPVLGVVTNFSGALPGSFSSTACAAEGGTCAVTGTVEIAYGAGTSWKLMTVNANTACTNAVFGDPVVGTLKACYARGVSGGSGGGLTSSGFFYSRVQVCESSGGALADPRADLCQRYPSGNYKPVGNLQKYSDRVRVAAFGYLNDSSNNPQRHGGVLRAPMKYVGEKAFDSNFALISGTNGAREWNETDGTLVRDPDAAGGPNSGTGSNWPNQPMSGVINYLNQFGRTGTFGQYKTYDPVGELYYESLRYIQGLQPTNVASNIGSSATYGITDTLRDGFPVYTTWTDPHPAVSGMTNYSCVRNNIVGIGDVNTWNDRSFPGNPSSRTGNGDFARTASDSANEPDFYFWTKVVGGFESNTAVSYVDGRGVTRTTSNPNTPVTARWGMENQNIGASNASYYMAGAAYWANTHDIRGTQWSDTAKQRPGMRVSTYWLDVNEYGQQTSPSVHRASNQFYFTAKYGGFKDVTESGNPFKMLTPGTKPADNSFVNDPANLNWQRQTSDTNLAEAKNYFLSSSAQQVLDALDQIFANIASEANSIAGGAISTQRLTTTGGLVYQAQFDPSDWSGDLVAYPVSLASSSAVSIGKVTDSPWKNGAGDSVGAAGKLDERDIATRNIYVGYNSGSGTPVFDTAEFLWNGSLPTSVKNALRLPPGAASAPYDSDVIATARLNYLRGDRASEAAGSVSFRRRGSRLGDIVNSGVAFSGAPSRRISDSSYASFLSTYQNRTKALFVGSNDGMLHAFNAETGDELFGYIPSWVVPKLTALTSSSYVHQSYVDGTPVVAEANLGSTSSADWRTVLVAGTGAGGQGVFALDVSDPASFGSGAGNGKVLWEFTDKHDADLGNVVGKPQILKINTAAGGTTPVYEFFAVVASGVNNHIADGSASTTAEPALFLLKLNKGKSATWSLGDNYFKIKFPVKTNTITSGMIGFSARAGFADALTYLYAGDLQGNLWKLDFTKTSASAWTLDALSAFKNSGTAVPMYVAKDGEASPNRQPISMEPALVFGANRSVIVSFGTGKFLEVSDTQAPFKAQSVYAVLDNNSNTVDTVSTPEAAIAGRGRLMGGTISGSTVAVAPFNWGRPTADNSSSSRAGWYFDFDKSATTTTPANAGTGERQISGFGVLAGRLLFGSVIPAQNSCDDGSGKLYVIDLFTGDGSAALSTVGILGEPFIMQLGSAEGRSNSSGGRMEKAHWQVILQGSAGVSAPPSILTEGSTGRLSWREISNYQNLRKVP